MINSTLYIYAAPETSLNIQTINFCILQRMDVTVNQDNKKIDPRLRLLSFWRAAAESGRLGKWRRKTAAARPKATAHSDARRRQHEAFAVLNYSYSIKYILFYVKTWRRLAGQRSRGPRITP